MSGDKFKTYFLYLLLSTLYLSTLSQSTEEDDGQYHPGKYLGPDGEDGQYVHDNSGQYIIDNSGLYKPDESGRYNTQSSGFYGKNIQTFRNPGFGTNFNNFNPISKFAHSLVRPNNHLGEFEDSLGNRRSFGKASSSNTFESDLFVSSTVSPLPKILHRKPLQEIKNVDFFKKPSNQNSFFGNSPSGTSFNPKTTHSALRYPKYTQNRYDESNALIIKQNADVGGDGYHWDFETENGIQAEETGKIANKGNNLEAMRAKGFFKYTGPDNKIYSVMYTADENGFVAQGNHLPTPPPIPEKILKSLNIPRSGPRGKF